MIAALLLTDHGLDVLGNATFEEGVIFKNETIFNNTVLFKNDTIFNHTASFRNSVDFSGRGANVVTFSGNTGTKFDGPVVFNNRTTFERFTRFNEDVEFHEEVDFYDDGEFSYAHLERDSLLWPLVYLISNICLSLSFSYVPGHGGCVLS